MTANPLITQNLETRANGISEKIIKIIVTLIATARSNTTEALANSPYSQKRNRSFSFQLHSSIKNYRSSRKYDLSQFKPCTMQNKVLIFGL